MVIYGSLVPAWKLLQRSHGKIEIQPLAAETTVRQGNIGIPLNDQKEGIFCEETSDFTT